MDDLAWSRRTVSRGGRRARARESLDRLLARSPIHTLFHRLANGLAILAYHHVTDPDRFSAQLGWLCSRYHLITPGELLAALAGSKPLPQDAVLITFDDADPSHLEHALPLLRERELSAIAFTVAGPLDTELPFWWHEAEALHAAGGRTSAFSNVRSSPDLVRRLKGLKNAKREQALRELRATAAAPVPHAVQLRREQLRTLEAGGIEIGNHSLTHPILSRCPSDVVRTEVTEAHEQLTSALGRPPRFFAYPNGNFDRTAAKHLRRLGYQAAFLFDHRRPSWPPPDPFRISRLRVSSETSLDRFKIIVSGLHPALHHLLRRP